MWNYYDHQAGVFQFPSVGLVRLSVASGDLAGSQNRAEKDMKGGNSENCDLNNRLTNTEQPMMITKREISTKYQLNLTEGRAVHKIVWYNYNNNNQ